MDKVEWEILINQVGVIHWHKRGRAGWLNWRKTDLGDQGLLPSHTNHRREAKQKILKRRGAKVWGVEKDKKIL